MRSDPDLDAGLARAAGRFEVARLLPLGVIVAVMVLVVAFGQQRSFSLESLMRHRAMIDAFIAAHRFGALGAYMAIYIAVVSLSLPGTFMLTMIGGVLFGIV